MTVLITVAVSYLVIATAVGLYAMRDVVGDLEERDRRKPGGPMTGAEEDAFTLGLMVGAAWPLVLGWMGAMSVGFLLTAPPKSKRREDRLRKLREEIARLEKDTA